ncbi:Sugar transporter STL1 [Golovinomyces cichoracearum]|uniref:Sugar transporter STL1 n=1 Tax=Golovinomyces cichoracearum TaxID=62708 RepID=A0A420I7R5_9PEZI|nr:Sugar transporter STL1 [Golovinomyces cichoracearum]
MVFLNLRGNSLSVAQIALVVAPSFILFGYNQAGVGGLLTLPDWTKSFPEIDTIHTSGALRNQHAVLQGLVVSTFVLGAMAGCIACMFLGDFLGRRKSIFTGGVLTLVGQIICSSAGEIGQLITGRAIIGVSIGIFSSTIPVWQAECSPPAHRGKHVVLDGLFTTLGYALTSWTNFGASKSTSHHHSITWRLPLALPNIFSVILLVSIFFVPESPRWLVKVGRNQEATEVLSQLKDLPIEDPMIRTEISSIQSSLVESVTNKTSLKDMFTMGPDMLFYRFCLCIFLQFFQQMSGANLISVYAPVIFEQNLNLESQTARLLTGGALTWKFMSSFVAFFTIDRFGRRALFIFSGFGMGICMLILSVTTAMDENNLAASYMSVVAIFMFNFFVPIGFLGANFLYCAEVAPVSLRVGMAAISTANHWLWNLVVIMATPVAISSIGHWYFVFFAFFSFSIPAAVWLAFPETMGKSLEEIDMLFRDNETIRLVVRMSTKNFRSNKKEVNVIE